MILLTDEQMRAICYGDECKDNVTCEIPMAVEYSAKAQLKKVVEEKEGLGRFAKAYDMRIDGFVVPWDYWQSLLEEVK